MTKRMDRVKLQADLKKLQSYRSNLEAFKGNLENRASELSYELEVTGKYSVRQPAASQHSPGLVCI